MSLSLPRITVVTPSFNQDLYLEECIQSVIYQGYPNLEYVIMDGGSTDHSPSIIEKYSSYLSYWQSQKDNGQADAINEGFKRATGEIYGWLNSDDILCKNALWNIAEAFSKERNPGLIYGDSFLIDQYTNLLRVLISSDNFEHYKYGAANFFQGSVFFTKQAYETVGGLNTSLVYAMEYELFLKIQKQFDTRYIPTFLACFRCQPDSKSARLQTIARQECRDVFKRVCNIDIDSSEYRWRKLYFSILRRTEILNLKRNWHIRQSFYKRSYLEDLNHITLSTDS
jgi:glycosyltransferase involved in cell wall biosynthesis